MLKPLTNENVPLLYNMLKELSVQDRAFFNPHGFELDELRHLYDESGNYYYLYYQNEAFVGYGLLRTFGKYEVPSVGIIIWPEYRKKGYGKQLMVELLQEAKRLGYTRALFHVDSGNKSTLQLHKSLGFLPKRKEAGRYKFEVDIKNY